MNRPRPRLRGRPRRTSRGALSAVGGLLLTAGLLAGAPAAPAAADSAVHILYAWGDTSDGLLGDGVPVVSPGTVRATPAPVVDNATNVIQVGSDLFDSVALHDDGSVWTWGRADSLGDGSSAGRSTPGRVPGLPLIAQIAVRTGDVFAVGADGTLWGWGFDQFGQLGDGGSDAPRLLPVKVPLSGVARITVGFGFVLAQTSDGQVWAWGKNEVGQLGIGTTTNAPKPVKVPLPTGIVQLAAGSDFAMALCGDGTVWTWGEGFRGNLGDGTAVRRSTPAPADPRMTGITQIATGLLHNMALAGDGSVWTWGGNLFGQLGDGTTTTRLAPVHLPLSGVARISGAFSGSTAVTTSGQLYYWGANTNGATGLSTADKITQPTLDSRLTGVTTAALSDRPESPIIYAVAAAVRVPNLIGMNKSAAESAIISAGLLIGTRRPVPPDPQCLVTIGSVVAQSPPAGTIVVPRARINFSYVDPILAGRCSQ